MEKNLFQRAIARQNDGRPPVWFMRQAGRYHSHYQQLRAEHSFMDVCKKPEVAAEAAMGPIEDFDFDAAILFSDLLFPLEVMGMGLDYTPGPQLEWHIKSLDDAKKLKSGAELAAGLAFQAEAMHITRARLPEGKGLLGFVGGPLTLYCYAVEGSHKGNLDDAKAGLNDGRFDLFCDKLLDLLVENMVLQAEAGADTVAVLDTCAGELSPLAYKQFAVPVLAELMQRFKVRCPDAPISYYSKNTGPEHWESLTDLPISYKGIDWNHNLADVLQNWSSHWAIQGNIDPNWLFLETDELLVRLREVFGQVRELAPEHRAGWVAGLGHGVLPGTPEKNVRAYLKLQKEYFSES